MPETVTCEKACSNCGALFDAQMTELLGRFPYPISTFKSTPGTCPSCIKMSWEKREVSSLRRRLNFSREQVKAHFTDNPPSKGDALILCMQQYNQSRYRLVKIVNPDHGRQHRIIIDNGCSFAGASYYRTGQSTFAPKSQTFLLPFVALVADELSYEQDTELTDESLHLILTSNCLT